MKYAQLACKYKVNAGFIDLWFKWQYGSSQCCHRCSGLLNGNSSINCILMFLFLYLSPTVALLPGGVWSRWTEASGAAGGGGGRVYRLGGVHPAGQVTLFLHTVI